MGLRIATGILASVALAAVNGAMAEDRCAFPYGKTMPVDCPMATQANTCKGYGDVGGRLMAKSMPAQEKLAACTALVDSGRFQGKELALILSNRSDAYGSYPLRDFANALADADRAIALDPGNPNLYLGRSTTNNTKGDLPAAIADLDTYIQLSTEPGNKAVGIYHRAKTNQKLGNRDQAITDYKSYLAMEAQMPERTGVIRTYAVSAREELQKMGAMP